MKLFFLILFYTTPIVFGQIKVTKIANLPKKMNETSGLIMYNKKYFITHNDGGNKSEIYILNKKGEHIKTINVLNKKNHDWEDLTQDEKGNVYIGDFGNNYNLRKNLSILILEKGFINVKKVEAKKISFYYENQKKFPPKKANLNYDCEAFFYKDGFLYLLTKCRSKPFTGISYIYKIPAIEGKHKAKLIGQFQFCSTAWQFCSVTSANYYAKENTLTILTYGKLYVINEIKENGFTNAKINVYNISKIKQREAITYAGKNRWYMTDEYRKGFGGGNLYELHLK